ncbi:hypothetical protein [Mycobacterium sp. E188]|uniref:hypothetical protein n=1 Tax=Mycobacterium sp. E188 TaxID=1834130 RepID=UPI001E4BE29F|nr:hypothetical protein [Mycobacterium sp. E188]
MRPYQPICLLNIVASGALPEHHSDLIAVTSDLFQLSVNVCTTELMSASAGKFPAGNGLRAYGPPDGWESDESALFP